MRSKLLCVFTVLCIDDEDKKSGIFEIDSMTYAIAYPKNIWGESPIITNNEIKSGLLKCEVNKLKNAVNPSFEIKFTGEKDYLCDVRLLIVEHLASRINFNRVFVICDDVSKELAKDLYPRIYEAENALRGYIIKFFAVKYGADWYERTIDENTNKRTESVQTTGAIEKTIQNQIYNLHFADLYSFIGEFCTGYQTKQQVIDKLLRISTESELEDLKNDVQDNGQKHFKDTFIRLGFETKWKSLRKIRNSIAHNKIIDKNDIILAEQTLDEVEEIINNAMEKLDLVVVNENEFWQSVENQIEKQPDTGELKELSGRISHSCGLDEDIVLHELRISENLGKYVGLRSFVFNVLDKIKGYPYQAGYSVINKMKEQGKVEVYSIEDNGYTVSALRIPKN